MAISSVSKEVILPSQHSLWSQCQSVWRLPFRSEVYIISRDGMAGYIGQDQRCDFKNLLKTPQGNPIIPQPEDFYVTLDYCRIQKRTPLLRRITEFVLQLLRKLYPPAMPTGKELGINLRLSSGSGFVLPSTILSSVSEGSTISFQYDHAWYELTLRQQKHKEPTLQENFQDAFQHLNQSVQRNKRSQLLPINLFKKDISDGQPRLGMTTLSPQARLYSTEQGLTELTSEKLQKLNTIFKEFPSRIQATVREKESEYSVILATPGLTKELIILLDSHLIFLYRRRAEPEAAEAGNILLKEVPQEEVWGRKFGECNELDITSFRLQSLGNGTALLSYRLLRASPQTASLSQS